jgi:hypothetical protein
MTTIPNATSAATAPSPDTVTSLLHCSRTRVEFPCTDSVSNAPCLLQKLLSTIVDKNPGTVFYSSDDTKIDIEDFPTDKASFDECFNTVITSERRKKIVVGFEIRSAQTFYVVKSSVLAFVKKHGIYLKRHHAPLQTLDLVTVGWIHKLHPTFASLENLRTEIFTKVYEALESFTTEQRATLNIADTESLPEFFLSTSRIHGEYENAPIHSNVIILQAARSDSALVKSLLEAAFTLDKSVQYIPLSLKYENPPLHGQILSHQNQYLENHRNIAVAGLSVIAMDFRNPGDDSKQDTPPFWNQFLEAPGILRVDSCKRTFDLGKWNLSTTEEKYVEATQWIDDNLTHLYNQLPGDVKETCQFPEFPAPRRLTKTQYTGNQRTSHARPSSSVSSFASHLADKWGTTPNVAAVTRSAWRPPPQTIDISYDITEADFPLMTKNEGDTKSTASMTHATNVSTITEQIIKEAIEAETAKMHSESVKAAAVIEARFQKIDDSLQLLATQLVRDIFTQLTGSNSPFVTSSQLDQKLDRLSQQIEQLTNGTASSSRSVGSPHRKLARTNGPQVNSGEENPMDVEDEFQNCS